MLYEEKRMLLLEREGLILKNWTGGGERYCLRQPLLLAVTRSGDTETAARIILGSTLIRVQHFLNSTSLLKINLRNMLLPSFNIFKSPGKRVCKSEWHSP